MKRRDKRMQELERVIPARRKSVTQQWLEAVLADIPQEQRESDPETQARIQAYLDTLNTRNLMRIQIRTDGGVRYIDDLLAQAG